MSDGSKIEWTDATWNPITGCSVISPGCTNCYAMRLAGTRLRDHPSRAGLTDQTKSGPVWNGNVRLNSRWLDQPLRWKKPRRVFVCAHGDLFHEEVPDAWIDRVFAVMALAPQHVFQVLTKRAERMQDYCARAADQWHGSPEYFSDRFLGAMDSNYAWIDEIDDMEWPLPNVWLGVSAENHEWWYERAEYLEKTPAAVRWVSAEPLLGPIDFDRLALGCIPDWIVVGGESGPGARPMNPDWARDIRDFCKAYDVPFFMKQMAKKAPIPDDLMVRQWPGGAV